MQPLILRFAGPRIIELVELDLPEARADQASVRTLFTGISPGTEMLAYRGEIDPSLPLDETIGALGGTFEYPFEYGYSAVGVIDKPAGGFTEGDVVFAFQPHRSAFVASPKELIPIGDLDARNATLFPLVETALQISLDVGEISDRDVVVVGLGPVGILSSALLARRGGRVVGVDPLAWRRVAANAFGIEAVSPERAPTAIDERSGGRGVAVVVEASGNPDALANSLAWLDHEGLALVCSWFGTKQVPLPLGAEFHRKRLTLRSSQVSTIPSWLQAEWGVERRRKVALELMGELPLEQLATHTFPISEAARAFAAIDGRREGLIHAALSYEQPG
jgi:2-desacetyl-2-hydroxyethyl bacteriochlorophyllide A dehydrogenase